MASEIRVNSITNRSGLTTTTWNDEGLDVVGVATAFNFKTGTTNVHSTGIELANINTGGGTCAVGGNVNISRDLDVDGLTNLDFVNVSAASTFAGIATFTGALWGTTGTFSGSLNASSTKVGTIATISSGGIDLGPTGVCTALEYIGDGSKLTGIDASTLKQ